MVKRDQKAVFSASQKNGLFVSAARGLAESGCAGTERSSVHPAEVFEILNIEGQPVSREQCALPRSKQRQIGFDFSF